MEYPSYEFLVELHIFLMNQVWGETYYGVARPELLHSALARPRQAAWYENADGVRQAAYLFHGILMNHGFVQGNKRTAYALAEWFLWRNKLGVISGSDEDIVAFCYATENEKLSVTEVETWLRRHLQPTTG